jgi:tRNA threonylcarbamoyl adenosine modification protein YeaZ
MLALDTSTSAITAAVHDGDRVLASGAVLDPRRHTEHLAPLVERVLAEAGLAPTDLTDIAVGTGPGPFTGLRVGLVTGRVLGWSTGAAVHGVCSLDVLARQASNAGATGDLLVATDARRKEVYFAQFAVGGRVERVTDPAVERPADVPDALRVLPTVGRGPVLYPELLPNAFADVLDVDAAVLALVAAERIAAGEEMPVEALYLRRPDALTTAERAAR